MIDRMPPNQTKASRLSSSEQLDLWEHASFLYHNFEWQDASDAFRFLGEVMQDTRQRIFHHLNGALILARLGDFREALERAEVALYLDEHFALSYFLLGLIEAELGHTIESLQHFERCLDRMGHDDVDYNAQRLDFVLRASAVQDNASELWSALQLRQDSMQLPILNFIPADVLFEAPMRTESHRRTVSWESKPFTDYRLSLGQAIEGNASTSARSSRKNWLSRLKASSSRTSTGRASSTLMQKDGLESVPPDSEPMVLAPVTRRRVQHTPREAQTTYESTRELARFIRHAGPSTSNQKVTIDQEYMLRLLQQDSARASQLDLNNSPRLQPGALRRPLFRRSETDGYDGVLDYYTHPRRRHSMSALSEIDVLRDSQLLDNDDTESAEHDLRGRLSAAESPMRNDALIPLPLFHSRTKPAIALPKNTAKGHFAQRRLPAFGNTKDWLRKGLLAPRAHAPPDRVNTSGESSPTSSGVQTRAPSTVSSTEIFRFGLRDRKRN